LPFFRKVTRLGFIKVEKTHYSNHYVGVYQVFHASIVNPNCFSAFVYPQQPDQIEQVEEKLRGYKSPGSYFNSEFADFYDYVDVPISWNFNYNTYLNLADGVEIPSGLLLGPWDEQKIRHLYWIVRGGAKVDWVTSTTGEVCHCSMKHPHVLTKT
jgi:hypothetical protein